MYIQCITIDWSNKVIKRLTKHGNSMALVIDRSILNLLKIDPGTPLDISTDGERLIVSPIRDEARAAKFAESLDKINSSYGRALKNLSE